MIPLLLLSAAMAGEVEAGVTAGVAVPAGRAGSLPFGGAQVLTALTAHHALGLEASTAADPVTGAPAWAPAVAWRGLLRDSGGLDPFIAAALGFALADRPAEAGGNLARLAGHLSVGFQGAVPLGPRAALVLAPQLGLVPGAFFGRAPFSVAAPTASLRVALRWPSAEGTVEP